MLPHITLDTFFGPHFLSLIVVQRYLKFGGVGGAIPFLERL